MIITRDRIKSGLNIIKEIAIGALIGGVIIYAIVWFFILRHREAREEHARTVVQEEQTKATGEAAADSMTIVNETNRTITRIDEITRRNEDAITSAAGADAPAPAVGAALRDALCMYDAYKSEPRCVAVPGNGGGIGLAGSDGGGTAAAE